MHIADPLNASWGCNMWPTPCSTDHMHNEPHPISLQVISTKVGGVPEVLPSDMICMAEPNVSGEQ